MNEALDRLESLFAAALQKPPEDRTAYLDQACGDDAALRQRVEQLLLSHEQAGSFLGQPAPAHVAAGLARQEENAQTQGEPPGHDASSAALTFLTPTDRPGVLGRLEHYDILEVVGLGGMGIVLRGFDEKLHRVVAIKVMAAQLAANGTARKRFQREAQAAAAVSHDHIVTIHAVEETKDLPYLVMQYVSGLSLQQRLDRDGPLQLAEIVRIGMQTAAGLAAVHAQGLVHRDIKPANILLENGVERVKITDFGLARAATDANLTQSGMVAGTPQYMSPEQAEAKQLDQRSDLFSLGSVLYAMCTGRAPFHATGSVAVLKRVCEETPRPIRETNPDIPDWLVAIIDKLHAKDPAGRYQTAAEVAELLNQHLAHLQQPSRVPLPVTKPAKPPTAWWRRRAVAGVVLFCLAAILLGLTPALIGFFTAEDASIGTDDPEGKMPLAGGALKSDPHPFVVLGGAGVGECKFDTLAEAVLDASAGATIEVRGNGPFVSQPIKVTQALSIRAGAGYRPVIQLSPEATVAQDGLLESKASLIVEGLDLQTVPKALDKPKSRSLILARAPLHVANCRLLSKQSMGTPVINYGPICELRNCEIIGPKVYGIGSYHTPHLRITLDNCCGCLATGIKIHYLQYGGEDYTQESTIRLTRNTFVVPQQIVMFTVYPGQVKNLWTQNLLTKPMQCETEGNILDARSCVALFSQKPPGKILSLVEAEPSLPQVFIWHGTRNLYSVGGPFLKFQTYPDKYLAPVNPIKSVAEWGKYWGPAEAGSIAGGVCYQGGNLLAGLVGAPEKLTAEDFRLRPDSAGYKAGKDGKDLGVNVDLVGPGKAYEAWKKTPEYQKWLTDTKQVK